LTHRVAKSPTISAQVCSFCSGSIAFLDYPVAAVGDKWITCQGLKIQSLNPLQGGAVCGNIQQFEDNCCPAGQSGAVCSFCSGGLTFPDSAPALVDEQPATCQELYDLSLGSVASLAGCSNIQSSDVLCCADADRCEFCKNGLKMPDLYLTKKKLG